MTKREAVFSKDIGNKKLTVVRSFAASLEQVWKAWTTAEILDKWWGPKPYHVETKSMDFREGGSWLYAMVGPEGDKQWCIDNYKAIKPLKHITNTGGFCDEQGNVNTDFPAMNWHKQFSETGNDETTVNIELTFDKEADMEAILKMGFREGFTAGLENLDEVLSEQ